MIEKISVHIALFLVSHGLPSKNADIYRYGAECFLNLFICDLFLFIWAYFFHRLPEMVLWIVSYTLLRNHLGGWHAKAHWQCIIMSILTGIVSVLASKLWFLNPVMTTITVILLIVCLVITIRIAPVLHPNHPLSFRQRDRERIISIATVSVEIAAILIVFFFSKAYAGALASGVLTAFFLAVIGYYFNLRPEN